MSATTRSRPVDAAWWLVLAVVGLAATLVVAPSGAQESSAPSGAAVRDQTAPTAPFADVPLDHPFVSDITWLSDEGIGEGYDDGTFGPRGTVSRGAMAAFLARYRGATPSGCNDDAFTDVPATHPFCAEIAWLTAEGIADGFGDGTYRPSHPVSRQAMAAFLARVAGVPTPSACATPPHDDVPADHVFCAEIAWLTTEGIAAGFGDGTYRPSHPVSRQAMAAFLRRLDAFDARPVPSPGCGTSTVGAQLQTQVDLDVGGTPRWYLLTTPAAHDGVTPLPLVLDFHGLAEGAQIHTQMSAFSPLAQSEGFVVAFPHGTGNPVRWNTGVDPTTNPDLVYLDAVLDDLADDLCIDLSRVFAAGLSNGAMMSSALACAWSDRFAAAVPVAGILWPSGCAPTRPVPMLTYHGTADPILKFNGGIGTLPGTTTSGPTTTTAPPDLHGPGYPATVATWAAANGCDPVPTDTQETDEVIRRLYDCPRHADVEFTIVLGGGHAWPGSAFSQSIAAAVGYTTFDADATAEAWAFFQRHHR